MKTLKKASTTATYVYNALDQLVKQSGGPSATVLYVYDDAGHLLGEYNSTGGLIQETIWLGDTPVATLRPGTPVGIFYVHTDHLNTPRKVTRPSDNKARWTWESDPFGTATPNENPQSLGAFKYNLRFPGQIYDSHGGLMQNYFRDYDPMIGRYVESDPVGLAGGINTYAYVRGNALSYVDPLRLFDIRGFYRADDPGLILGEAIGGMAAFGIGKITGNEALCNVAAEDLSANRQKNVDTFFVLMGGKGGGARGFRSGAGKVHTTPTSNSNGGFTRNTSPT